jgi:hypothetical protein
MVRQKHGTTHASACRRQLLHMARPKIQDAPAPALLLLTTWWEEMRRGLGVWWVIWQGARDD